MTVDILLSNRRFGQSPKEWIVDCLLSPDQVLFERTMHLDVTESGSRYGKTYRNVLRIRSRISAAEEVSVVTIVQPCWAVTHFPRANDQSAMSQRNMGEHRIRFGAHVRIMPWRLEGFSSGRKKTGRRPTQRRISPTVYFCLVYFFLRLINQPG